MESNENSPSLVNAGETASAVASTKSTGMQVSGGLSAMTRRDKAAHRAVTSEYFQHWDSQSIDCETAEARQIRSNHYAGLTQQYYSLSTDIFEHAWGESFHFCRFGRGESFQQAIARHEHFLASMIGIRSNMRVLDVGCGVGGPAREIVKFTGCHVTGLNITDYQLQRARMYAKRDGLSHRLEFVEGDFMKMPFPDASFDAIYVMEATVHAPSLQDAYSEIYRVLKPGGRFGVYEWVLTDSFDDEKARHRRIRQDIEKGYGIAAMATRSDAVAAVRAAGFELETHRDLGVNEDQLDVVPWYWPMGNDLRHAQSMWDVLSLLPKSRIGAIITAGLLGLLETLGIVPPGTKKTADIMGIGAEALVAGGEQGIFTPMYLMVGRKPDIAY